MTTDYGDLIPHPDASAISSVTRVVRERWWVIALATVIGLGIGVLFVVTTPKSYTATATLLVQPSSTISDAILQNGGSSEDPTRIAATDLLLMTSTSVADAARVSLRSKTSAADLLDQVTASEEPNADLYDITASDNDPATAARIANAFATGFMTYSQSLAQQQALAAQQQLQQRLAALPSTDKVDVAALHAALQRVISIGAVQSGSASVVGTAAPPTTASSPKPKLDGALGLILGLAFGLGLAFVLDLVDHRMKDVEDFEAAYGLRVLAQVPARTLSATDSDPTAAAFEPFRVLAGTLRFSRATRGLRSLLITSAVAGEGKTSVAIGLAKALADSGLTVTLVELDQRRPSFLKHFPIPADTGLTTVIMNSDPVAAGLQEPYPDLPNLRVLPTGPAFAANPLELLRSVGMDRVMEQLLDSEIVIYDAPPIVGVADTQALLDHPRIDASLIVARANRTTREEAKRACAILDQRVVKPLGLVLTGLEEPGATGYYYGGPRPASHHPRQTNDHLRDDMPAAQRSNAEKT
jgi:capsular exopolysaccharide synthesis family protein